MDYRQKYLKYKAKYVALKNMMGGAQCKQCPNNLKLYKTSQIGNEGGNTVKIYLKINDNIDVLICAYFVTRQGKIKSYSEDPGNIMYSYSSIGDNVTAAEYAKTDDKKQISFNINNTQIIEINKLINDKKFSLLEGRYTFKLDPVVEGQQKMFSCVGCVALPKK